MEIKTFYLSNLIEIKIFSPDFLVIGKLKDLVVSQDIQNPKVVAAAISTIDGIKYIKWDNVKFQFQNNKFHITCYKIEEVSIENMILLHKQVFDKQIIDINGRKVVRVNDVRLAIVSAGLFVVAVDISTRGILRRLGILKLFSLLRINLPAKLILWSDVETLVSQNDNLMLSKTYNKLKTLHPSDLADIIEDIDSKTGMLIFSQLDNSQSADVLEEMEEEKQLEVIENLTPEKAADILEEMPADEVADILDNLPDERKEELLNSMEKEASDEVRELLEYEDDIVGSLMSTDFISFRSDATILSVLNHLRETKPDEDQMYYIFVTNNKNKLIGTCSLRDLVISDPHTTLKNILRKDYLFMYDTDKIDELVKIINKYNLVAIPVVDKEKELVGSVILNDIMDEILKSNPKISA